VHRHNARLPGSGQSAVGGTGAGLSDHRATCVTAESWCGRAAGIDGPTWVMATYKIADCTRYIPYPIYVYIQASWAAGKPFQGHGDPVMLY
jgi:hypothetical protein